MTRVYLKYKKGVVRQNDGQPPNYGLQYKRITAKNESWWTVGGYFFVFLCIFS